MRTAVFLLCVSSFCLSSVLADKVLPAKFYGKWSAINDKNENFDEYLSEKGLHLTNLVIFTGYGWLTRRLVLLATFEKVFKEGSRPNTFSYENNTSKKNVAYSDVTLGQVFEAEGLDSTMHKIKFYLKDGHLFEEHIHVDTSKASEDETYEYYIEGEYFVVRMKANNVVARRFYKRLE